MAGAGCALLLGCAPPAATNEVPAPSVDQAWVNSACAAASPDTTGWPRYRIGDLTIAVPKDYRASEAEPYTLRFRGSYGTLTIVLHRNARYQFDVMNVARRGQVWCNGSLGGHSVEVLAWREPFRGASYNFNARGRATWGGQDVDKWMYVQILSSRLRDAYVLRDALHTIAVAPTAR